VAVGPVLVGLRRGVDAHPEIVRTASEVGSRAMRTRGILPGVVLLAGLLARGGRAQAGEDEVPAVPQEHVEASLAQAGKNRPAIEAYLAHYAKSGDAKRVAASRWLVANMAGKGFVPFT